MGSTPTSPWGDGGHSTLVTGVEVEKWARARPRRSLRLSEAEGEWRAGGGRAAEDGCAEAQVSVTSQQPTNLLPSLMMAEVVSLGNAEVTAMGRCESANGGLRWATDLNGYTRCVGVK